MSSPRLASPILLGLAPSSAPRHHRVDDVVRGAPAVGRASLVVRGLRARVDMLLPLRAGRLQAPRVAPLFSVLSSPITSEIQLIYSSAVHLMHTIPWDRENGSWNTRISKRSLRSSKLAGSPRTPLGAAALTEDSISPSV